MRGNLNIDATGAINAQGQLIAGGDLNVSSESCLKPKPCSSKKYFAQQ
ncbi:hypothetical protein I5592_18930 [Acinetobacter baumannii]|nr:hypothetical protein I5592_18930 [Acinetobacter baumannii]